MAGDRFNLAPLSFAGRGKDRRPLLTISLRFFLIVMTCYDQSSMVEDLYHFAKNCEKSSHPLDRNLPARGFRGSRDSVAGLPCKKHKTTSLQLPPPSALAAADPPVSWRQHVGFSRDRRRERRRKERRLRTGYAPRRWTTSPEPRQDRGD